MVRAQATPDFFEGLLLGNGDLGVCVTLRQDALGLHIGKNDCWDIRVSEEHDKDILPYKEFLNLWERASAEAKRLGKPEMTYMERHIDFFDEYEEKMHASYNQRWPRPWPSGIAWFHWDSRMVRVLKQTLDPSNGLATVDLEYDNLRGDVRRLAVQAFVSRETGHVSVSTTEPAPFLSVAYYPYTDPDSKLPPPDLAVRDGGGFGEFTCYQHFLAKAPTAAEPNPPHSEKDANFSVCARLAGEWEPEPVDPDRERGPRAFFQNAGQQRLRFDLAIVTSRDHRDSMAQANGRAERLSGTPVSELQTASEKAWKRFWSRSAVELADRELERIWYHNQYFLACCLRPGTVAPGLYGNWMSRNIGTVWHGDYHLDYNAEQVYWGVFSSNHVEQHLPYVELLESLQPMVERVAREHFDMPGAFYPVTVYPIPSLVNPYPAPPWFYMMCVAPWAVQSLWWHYLYTQDTEFLRRAYPMLAAVSRFMCAFMTKGDDGKYHVVPTVSSENWGCTVDYRLNRDGIMDLSLTAFVLDASVEAAAILGVDTEDAKTWVEVRENMAPYPSGKGPFGEVWLDVLDAPAEHVYNVSAPATPVFPAEQVGIGLRPEQLEIARRTVKYMRLEGGNDLVFQPLIRARLGMLDLEWFKREVRFAMLPNDTATLRTRQIGGRYSDWTRPGYMSQMGIWVENFSLPAVLNECMMQSYTGVIRLFPNAENLGRAKFTTLRAAGAFLVSAAWDGEAVEVPVEILSEKGGRCRIAAVWRGAGIRVIRVAGGKPVDVAEADGVFEFHTEPGQTYRIERA